MLEVELVSRQRHNRGRKQRNPAACTDPSRNRIHRDCGSQADQVLDDDELLEAV